MKKAIIYGLAVLLLMGFFAACGAIDNDNTPAAVVQNNVEDEADGTVLEQPVEGETGEEIVKEPVEEETEEEKGEEPVEEEKEEEIIEKTAEEEYEELVKKYEGVNFTEDRVILVLTKEASKNYDKTYTPEDFPEIGSIRVDEFTDLFVLYKAMKEAEETGNWDVPDPSGSFWTSLEERRKYNALPNLENFKRIPSVVLAEESRENVLKAIQILSKRADVEVAEPNTIHKLY